MEKDLAYSEDKNNRKFARYIKSKTKSKTAIGPLITREKKMLTEDRDMAEELNTFCSMQMLTDWSRTRFLNVVFTSIIISSHVES
jgi:hypothetical protein